MKKILLLFAAMCCMMTANAQQFEDVNGIKYNVTSEENKTVEVISKAYAGYSGDIVIPDKVTYENVTYSVTGIGDEAFDRCDLASVTLPNSVTYIGDEAFYNCDELASITLPNSLESIGVYAFRNCYKLASISLSNGIKSIGNYAFEYCESLTSITIPSSVKSIGEGAFGGCSLMASISVDEGNTVYDSRDNCNAIIETATNTLIAGCNNTVIPSSITAIGKYAFEYLVNLTSIIIPSSVTSIGGYAFYECENLASITIPSSVESIGSCAFGYCDKLASVSLSNGIKSIGDYAFVWCENLTSITIPNTVTEIETYAFSHCFGLTSITVLALTPPTLGYYVFNDIEENITVYVPNVATYTSDTSWSALNIEAIDINVYINAALDEIEVAMEDVSLSEDEEDEVDAYIATIEAVKTLSDDNLTIIENAKNAALAIINQAAIRPVREAALAAIEEAMQGETSAYLTGLVQEDIATINSTTDVTAINNAKNNAVAALNAAIGTYKTIKAEALGTLGTKQNGPAVKVTDQDDESVILYNPKKVEFIKVSTEE